MFTLFSLIVVKDCVVEEEQVFCACSSGKEHAGNVFCALVVFHTQEVACPAKVLLVAHSQMALESSVQAFSSCALFEKQQPQLFLVCKNTLNKRLHFLGWDMVNIHAHRVSYASRSFETSILIRQARIVELQETALQLIYISASLREANLRHGSNLSGRVAQSQILFSGRDWAHHLAPLVHCN